MARLLRDKNMAKSMYSASSMGCLRIAEYLVDAPVQKPSVADPHVF
jgi:hypothetical protein